jgi:hypothetical protein
MLRTILIAIALLLAVGVASAADQSVKGYIRKDGTYVQPYHRTAPNNNLYDNYSKSGCKTFIHSDLLVRHDSFGATRIS